MSSGPWLEETPISQRKRSGGTRPGWQSLGQKFDHVRNGALFCIFSQQTFFAVQEGLMDSILRCSFDQGLHGFFLIYVTSHGLLRQRHFFNEQLRSTLWAEQGRLR